jgi:hypothetical protein
MWVVFTNVSQEYTASIFGVERVYQPCRNGRLRSISPVAQYYVARRDSLIQKPSSWPSRDRTPEANLETYGLFIYGDVHYITNAVCKNVRNLVTL